MVYEIFFSPIFAFTSLVTKDICALFPNHSYSKGGHLKGANMKKHEKLLQFVLALNPCF